MSEKFKAIHPAFAARKPLWDMMTHAYEGEQAVKDQRDTYLPPTVSMILDGFPALKKSGTERYNAWLMNAVFPDYVEHAVNSAISRMHRKEPTSVNFPGGLNVLEERASSMDEDMPALMRRVNVEQIKNGRVGALGEVEIDPVTGLGVPVINLYSALKIVNWDDSSSSRNTTDARLVILDESKFILSEDYTWKWKEIYRVLAMCEVTVVGDGETQKEELKPSAEGTVYAFAIMQDNAYDIMGAEYTAIEHRGNRLDRIPFAFINTMDIASNPDTPPLLGLANLCMTIYRGEASYRNTLYMQGENTLVKIGDTTGKKNEPTRTGTGASISVPIGGDAKFIGFSGDGLAEQRTALENDHKRAGERAGKLADSIGERASGEALRVRLEAQNVTLPQIAMTGADGIKHVAKIIAPLFGTDPDAIELEPNIEFSNSIIDGKTLNDIATARANGAPISRQSIHRYAVEQGLTVMSYEDEIALVDAEESERLANTPSGNIVPGNVDPNENV